MTKIEAKHVEDELSKLKTLEGRTPFSSDDDLARAFTTLAPFDNGGIFTGTYSGDTSWERHTAGDELVHILKGSTKLTILTDDDTQTFNLTAGMLIAVPKGLWHRFSSKELVTVLAATPQPTEHSTSEDPRL
jgi:mannose-6-phosphate isomerase-like protein (cupin superfamily)